MSRGRKDIAALFRPGEPSHVMRPFRIKLQGMEFLCLPDRSVYEVCRRGLRKVRDKKMADSVWDQAFVMVQRLARKIDEKEQAAAGPPALYAPDTVSEGVSKLVVPE